MSKKAIFSALFFGFMVVRAWAVDSAFENSPGTDMNDVSESIPGTHRADDEALSCLDLQREAEVLDLTIDRYQMAIEGNLAAPNASSIPIRDMAASVSSGALVGAGRVASSLMGAVPGVGTIGGLAIGIATDAAIGATVSGSSPAGADATGKSPMHQAIDARLALIKDQARHQRVVEMFLDKRCKLY